MKALAELSSDGARGLLSSRPNYFSEAEELHILDVLYATVERGRIIAPMSARRLVQQEQELDQLLEVHFLERYERHLRDLDARQTRELVSRILEDDAAGREVVLGLLDRVFRTTEEGAAVSLSGKPVIISFLLEVVEQLKTNVTAHQEVGQLTEWDVYKLVVDQLMFRDLEVGQVEPERRRVFLQQLALELSRRASPILDEAQFREFVTRQFRGDRRVRQAHDRNQVFDQIFDDVRRSATLTRSADPAQPGWRFSHNSLREFLVAEFLMSALEAGQVVAATVPVTDAMRSFVASRPRSVAEGLLSSLAERWGTRSSDRSAGLMLSLLWDAAARLFDREDDPSAAALVRVAGPSLGLNGITLERLRLSSESRPCTLKQANLSESEFTSIVFEAGTYSGTNFRSCLFDGGSFAGADLTDADLSESVLLDVNFSGAVVSGADFRSMDLDSAVIVEDPDTGLPTRRLEGPKALGYLSYKGAKTDAVDLYLVLCNHPRFNIVLKIASKLAEQRTRQRRGLEQRGEAQKDVPFARAFVEHLLRRGLVRTPLDRADLLEVTQEGRQAFVELTEEGRLPVDVADFLRPD